MTSWVVSCEVEGAGLVGGAGFAGYTLAILSTATLLTNGVICDRMRHPRVAPLGRVVGNGNRKPCHPPRPARCTLVLPELSERGASRGCNRLREFSRVLSYTRRCMNPIVLHSKVELYSALANESQHHDGQWHLSIPLHRLIHRVTAAWIVLRGKALVLKVD